MCSASLLLLTFPPSFCFASPIHTLSVQKMAGHPYCKSLLLLSLAFLLFIAFTSVAEGSGSAFAGDLSSQRGGSCGSKCKFRCSATSHKKPCLFFCNQCCKVCNCVPPGTYGNKLSCPCYNNWKTKEGGPKCP